MTQSPSEPRKTAVVTGGGAGIGREIALAFADAGWHVHICGRTLAPLADVARHDHITYSQCDITDEAQVAAMFADALRASGSNGGRIAAVVLNAGLPGTPAEFGDTDIEDFRRVIDTNVVGSFLCAREAFRIMKGTAEGTGGRILVNCSIAAQVPRAHTAAYAASKSALAGLTRVLALDGREHGILATRIDIGNAKTDLLGAFTGEDDAEPMFDAAEAARAFVYAAELPATAVVDHLTITAAGMPFLGRG